MICVNELGMKMRSPLDMIGHSQSSPANVREPPVAPATMTEIACLCTTHGRLLTMAVILRWRLHMSHLLTLDLSSLLSTHKMAGTCSMANTIGNASLMPTVLTLWLCLFDCNVAFTPSHSQLTACVNRHCCVWGCRWNSPCDVV